MMLVAAVAAEREAVHGQTGSSPVAKVLQLLQNLENQVQQEGAAEAATYKEFSCFCKDKQLEKDELIKSKTSSDDSLTADIEQLTAKKETLESELTDLNADLDFDDGALKRMIALRDKEYTNWKVVYDDTVDAVNSAKDAIASIKASGGALVQVAKMPRKIKELLQQGEEPSYEFASGGILQTLETLEDGWVSKKTSLEQQEDAARVAYENAKTKMEDKITTEKDSISTKSTELADTEKSLGTKTKELTETKALKKDAETYLKDLTEQCERKAHEWDQRSSMRDGELKALDKALELMGTVETKATDSGAGGRTGVKPVAGLTQEEDDADSNGADKTDDSYADVVFVQTREVKAVKHETSTSDIRNKVITILKSKASKLKSPAINMLAMKLAANPFAKVKELIQQLIERLNTEALNEANQKGYCDKELANAKHDAEYRLQDTKTLSASVLQLEAQKANLKEVITETTAELATLNKALNDATKLRGEEKAENKQTLTAAREGKAALDSAIDVLSTFYKKGSRAGGSGYRLLQKKQSPVDSDLAAGGHQHRGVYKGNQAQAGGILGMLATIQSDFERTIKQTTTEEETSRADFAAFSKETKASIKSNEQGLENAKGDLQITSSDIVQSLSDLRENQVLLDNSVKQLEMLRPQCIDTGMSWDDRKQAREREIQALKDCLDVFAEGLPSETFFLQRQ
jgi:hypothetical protein